MGVLQNFQKFRVPVWKCSELTEVPGIVARAYRTHKFRAGTKHVVPVPRVLWDGSYRTHRNSGYGYESLTELPEVWGTGMKVLHNFLLWHGCANLQKFRAGMKMPYLGYLWHWRTELTEVPGTGMNILQNFQKFRVRVKTQVNTRPRGRSLIWSGGFHRACMACSH